MGTAIKHPVPDRANISRHL